MRVIGPMPLLPLSTASQADGTVLPTGEMIPRPVTTTRRLLTLYLCGVSEGCEARGREMRSTPPARRLALDIKTLCDAR
jgi:hypothetical protein